MMPQAPGEYRASHPAFGSHKIPFIVYLSKKGHLRARVADCGALSRGETFSGKKVSSFSPKWKWEAAHG